MLFAVEGEAPIRLLLAFEVEGAVCVTLPERILPASLLPPVVVPPPLMLPLRPFPPSVSFLAIDLALPESAKPLRVVLLLALPPTPRPVTFPLSAFGLVLPPFALPV